MITLTARAARQVHLRCREPFPPRKVRDRFAQRANLNPETRPGLRVPFSAQGRARFASRPGLPDIS